MNAHIPDDLLSIESHPDYQECLASIEQICSGSEYTVASEQEVLRRARTRLQNAYLRNEHDLSRLPEDQRAYREIPHAEITENAHTLALFPPTPVKIRKKRISLAARIASGLVAAVIIGSLATFMVLFQKQHNLVENHLAAGYAPYKEQPAFCNGLPTPPKGQASANYGQYYAPTIDINRTLWNVCQQNLLVPLNQTAKFAGMPIMLEGAYADINQILIVYRIDQSQKTDNHAISINLLVDEPIFEKEHRQLVTRGFGAEFSGNTEFYLVTTIDYQDSVPDLSNIPSSLKMQLHLFYDVNSASEANSVSETDFLGTRISFTIPFYQGYIAVHSQQQSANSVPVTLEATIITPSSTRFYYTYDVKQVSQLRGKLQVGVRDAEVVALLNVRQNNYPSSPQTRTMQSAVSYYSLINKGLWTLWLYGPRTTDCQKDTPEICWSKHPDNVWKFVLNFT